MKIVAALPNHHGSGYHRALVPLRALAVRGHHVALTDLADPDESGGADVLYLPLAQSERIHDLAFAFQRAGGRVVYEFDDDYRATPASNPVARLPQFAERVAWMNRIMRLADAVVTSTPVLAEAYADLNPRAFVCHNAIDPLDAAGFFGHGEPADDGEIRIGWAGSQSHRDDVAGVVAPVSALLEALPAARFVMVGANFTNLFPADVRERVRFAGHTWYVDDDGTGRPFCAPGEPWPSVRYYHLVAAQRLHVALAPLADDTFNRSKSDLKLLEYGALGIPVVASDVTPYRAYVDERGGEGAVRLVHGPDEWLRALVHLATVRPARETLRRTNRANVLRRHLIYHEVDAWEQALAAVTGTPRAAR